MSEGSHSHGLNLKDIANDEFISIDKIFRDTLLYYAVNSSNNYDLANPFGELVIKIEDMGRNRTASQGADLGRLEVKAISHLFESGFHKFTAPSSFVAGFD